MNARTHSRLARSTVEAGAGAVFFATAAHHIYNLDFEPLASLCLPILAVFFTFTSLLYIRAGSLSRGRQKFRTLFAAERSMQAAVVYLGGIVLGTAIYGVTEIFPFSFNPQHPGLADLWLLLFLAPYALMQFGFLLGIRAAWIVAPQFGWGASRHTVWRRISSQS